MELPEVTKNPVQFTEVIASKSSPTSLLLSSLAFESSGETLRTYVHRNRSVEVFLRLMGVLWTANSKSVVSLTIQYAWNGLLRCGLVSMIAFGLYIAISDTIAIPRAAAFFLFMGLTVSLQSITLWLSLTDIHKRLHRKVSSHSVLHLNDGLKSAYLVFFLSLCIASPPLYYFFSMKFQWTFLIYYIGSIAVCCILTAAMYFISTDCSVANSLLDQLIEQERLQLLTFEQYSLVRSEVEACQSSSKWINNSVVVVAMLDVFAVFCFFYISGLGSPLPDALTMFAVLLKEIPFLVIVYWQVAQVNEKSALFMKSLATHRWTANPSSSSSYTDSERMAIFINAQGSPIVMSIAGMKLKRRDLAWQLAVWCIAFAISVMKATIVESV